MSCCKYIRIGWLLVLSSLIVDCDAFTSRSNRFTQRRAQNSFYKTASQKDLHQGGTSQAHAVDARQTSQHHEQRPRGWRPWRKVHGNGSKEREKMLRLKPSDEVEQPLSGSSSSSVGLKPMFDDAFVRNNFATKRPFDVFGEEGNILLEEIPQLPLKKPQGIETLPSPSEVTPKKKRTRLSRSKAASNAAPSKLKASFAQKLMRGRFQRVISGLVERWAEGDNVDMNVVCEPTSSVARLLLGQVRCDASVDFEKLQFSTIRMSRGRVEAKRLALNLWSFMRFLKARKRFTNQFDFYAHDVTFTQEDLFESSCIRDGLRKLLKRILEGRGMGDFEVTIDSIQILPCGKISCQGEAIPQFGSRVPFEVRSGLGTSGRGHILKFPGLEISLMWSRKKNFGFFVPVLPEITLDLGHNAQLLNVELDGKTASLRVSARVTITPEHTIKMPQNYIQSTNAYAALTCFDVGRWLTRLGRFTQ